MQSLSDAPLLPGQIVEKPQDSFDRKPGRSQLTSLGEPLQLGATMMEGSFDDDFEALLSGKVQTPIKEATKVKKRKGKSKGSKAKAKKESKHRNSPKKRKVHAKKSAKPKSGNSLENIEAELRKELADAGIPATSGGSDSSGNDSAPLKPIAESKRGSPALKPEKPVLDRNGSPSDFDISDGSNDDDSWGTDALVALLGGDSKAKKTSLFSPQKKISPARGSDSIRELTPTATADKRRRRASADDSAAATLASGELDELSKPQPRVSDPFAKKSLGKSKLSVESTASVIPKLPSPVLKAPLLQTAAKDPEVAAPPQQLQKIASLEAQISTLEIEIDTCRKERSAALSIKESEIDVLQSRLKAAEGEISVMRSKLLEKEEQFESIEVSHRNSKDSISELQSKLRIAYGEIDALKTQLSSKTQLILEQEQALSGTVARIEEDSEKRWKKRLDQEKQQSVEWQERLEKDWKERVAHVREEMRIQSEEHVKRIAAIKEEHQKDLVLLKQKQKEDMMILKANSEMQSTLSVLSSRLNENAAALEKVQSHVSAQAVESLQIRSSQLDGREQFVKNLQKNSMEQQRKTEEECFRLQTLLETMQDAHSKAQKSRDADRARFTQGNAKLVSLQQTLEAEQEVLKEELQAARSQLKEDRLRWEEERGKQKKELLEKADQLDQRESRLDLAAKAAAEERSRQLRQQGYAEEEVRKEARRQTQERMELDREWNQLKIQQETLHREHEGLKRLKADLQNEKLIFDAETQRLNQMGEAWKKQSAVMAEHRLEGIKAKETADTLFREVKRLQTELSKDREEFDQTMRRWAAEQTTRQNERLRFAREKKQLLQERSRIALAAEKLAKAEESFFKRTGGVPTMSLPWERQGDLSGTFPLPKASPINISAPKPPASAPRRRERAPMDRKRLHSQLKMWEEEVKASQRLLAGLPTSARPSGVNFDDSDSTFGISFGREHQNGRDTSNSTMQSLLTVSTSSGRSEGGGQYMEQSSKRDSPVVAIPTPRNGISEISAEQATESTISLEYSSTQNGDDVSLET